ncbi:DUF4935 domain-containing protein [Clavibacter sp. VKM Ac-2873]|uniref:PIN-like domain-containing protein n=1 Tax=Clavibacter sp. VKM Ac-2873 TaxID=2783813 RepID=UPI00188C7ED2|nr:PIN-like domain-containing protein [Clavibacter sp. VKM Ac-2873]MBF4618683.1 DUF4935 domain-containing protein [Clavibacter sp. VKM Ac-2873]
MRDTFRAYYSLDEQELESLWANAIIVLDTNTLLNFFRYTPGTRDEFLRVLESLQETLWLPYQVGLEFQERRLDVIRGTSEAFTKVKGSVDSAKNTVFKTLNEYKHHPSLNRSEVTTDLNELFAAFTKKIDEQRVTHEEWLATEGDPEKTFLRISALYKERVGSAFSAEQLVELKSEGEKRYEEKVPPGYKDAGKTNGNQYGDWILWKEILNRGKLVNQPIIFVTDDAKEDWWRIEHGETQGPRIELTDEYWKASGHRLHMYEPLQFLRHAKVRTKIPVSEGSLEEVKEVSNASDRALRVLRERRERLIQQREAQTQSIERRRRDSLNPEQQASLRAEITALQVEQQDMEMQRDRFASSVDELMSKLSGTHNEDARTEVISRLANQISHRTELENQLQIIVRRRAELERQLRRSDHNEDRISDLWLRRLRSLEDELKEVSLALDELGG